MTRKDCRAPDPSPRDASAPNWQLDYRGIHRRVPASVAPPEARPPVLRMFVAPPMARLLAIIARHRLRAKRIGVAARNDAATLGAITAKMPAPRRYDRRDSADPEPIAPIAPIPLPRRPAPQDESPRSPRHGAPALAVGPRSISLTADSVVEIETLTASSSPTNRALKLKKEPKEVASAAPVGRWRA